MDETCIHEYVYWTEFQSKRFYQILPLGFDRELKIPSKFVENVKDVCGTVSLKGPARKTWKVELNKTQDGLFFQNGWSQFVKDNCLQAGNFLVFKYSGQLHFDVSIFDHESLCEKACSFFVENRCCRVSKEPSSSRSPNGVPTSSKKHRSHRVKPSHPAPAFTDEVGEDSSSDDELENAGEDSSSDDELYEEGEAPPGFKRSVREHKSGRRAATEEEKKKVRQLADEAFAASSKGCFLLIMRKSHVYKRFLLTIPYDFALKHFPPKEINCTLCFEGQKRVVVFKPRRNSAGGMFTKGWADFVLENNIEEDDICLFEFVEPLQKQEEQQIVLNVRIFRVVKEMVPLICARTLCPGSAARKIQRGGASGRGNGRGRGRGRGLGRGRGRGRGRSLARGRG